MRQKDRDRRRADLIRSVETTIVREELIAPNQRILAAVSGGADSVCLLRLLNEISPRIPFDLTVAHVDHGLRGEESREDARFVESLVCRLGLPFHNVRLDFLESSPSDKKNSSPEALWREARYEALGRLAAETNADAVATGHTRDDLAETLLCRLIRGAGLRGLAAFGPETSLGRLRLIRPLIDLGREDIEFFLKSEGWNWREDASNRDLDRLRNQVRHELLPFLRQRFNPSMNQTLARTARAIYPEERELERRVDAELERLRRTSPLWPWSVDIEALDSLETWSLRRVLRRWIETVSEENYPPTYHEALRLEELIRSGSTGARFEWRRRWVFNRSRRSIDVARMWKPGAGQEHRG